MNPALVALAGTTTVAGTVPPHYCSPGHTQTAAPGCRGQRHCARVAARPRHGRAAAGQRTQCCRYRLPIPSDSHRRSIGRRVALDSHLSRRRCRRSRIELHIQHHRRRRIQGHRKGGSRRVNPVPLSVAELMVPRTVPVEVNVRGSVEAVFTVTLPNGRLAALAVNVGTAAFSCSAKLLETLPALAVRVTACAVATEDTVAVNPR